MKKWKLLAFLLCLALTMTACSKKDDDTSQTGGGEVVLENEYVSVGQYKGVSYTAESSEVTDEIYESELEAILEDYADTKESDRKTVEMGDYIIFDFAGTHNGEAMENGSATDAVLESVGEGGYIEGFEDNLVGAEVGKTFSFDITFPDPYSNDPSMSGEEATFEITVKGIYEKKVPKLDEDFVTNVQEYFPEAKTVEEFETALRADLEDYYKTQADDANKSSIWDTITATVVQKKVNEEALDQYKQEFRTYYESLAEYNSMEFADFLSSNLNVTEEEFEAEAAKYAESLSTEDEVVRLIADAEQIVVSEEDLTESYEKFETEYGMDQEAVIEYFGTEENFKRELLYEKVLDYVYENGSPEAA